MSKVEILLRLHEELAKAQLRQLPHTTKKSGCMRGLEIAIKIIEEQKE